MSTLPAIHFEPERMRILVVDDIVKNLQVVGAILRNEKYHVMPATSGPQALERLQAQLPDLVLLDLMMPEMDGLEVCRRLKADPLTAPVPVIFLTASNEMEHLVKGFEAGAVDYLIKPFNPSELLARVRIHLELKHARERLREMNKEKDEFMGIAAHDLRVPLTAIVGYAELILEDPQLQRAELEGLIERIRDTANRMTQMVSNLLNANAIERGDIQLHLTACDLPSLLTTVVESYRATAESKHQTFRLKPPAQPISVFADHNVTIQVLENLISNAVKYSPIGKQISAGVSVVNGAARAEVEDEGPGLNSEDMKKLFGKFARLSAKPTAGEQATGLGLSVVKKLVESMRGRVWCESELGKGCRFIVELPLA
jgi:two-component system sensor histidine kinase/response regulator